MGAPVTVTYRKESRCCGKATCLRCADGRAHGPYWYAYWHDAAGKLCRRYCGKEPSRVALPDEAGEPIFGPRLSITSLGTFAVGVGSQVIRTGDWARASSRQLLALLSLHPDGMHREEVMEALWADHPYDKALRTLTTAISDARRVLRGDRGDRAFSLARLRSACSRLRLELTPFDHIDIHSFLGCQSVLSMTTDELDKLASVPGSALLPEYQYEEWAAGPRERIQRVWEEAVSELARRYVDRGRDEMAIGHLERLLAANPAHEPGLRQLMLLLARRGDVHRAIEAYSRLESYLATELNAQPAIHSQALRSRLRAPSPGSAAITEAGTAHWGTRLPDHQEQLARTPVHAERAVELARTGTRNEALAAIESGKIASARGIGKEAPGDLLLAEAMVHNITGNSRATYRTAGAAEAVGITVDDQQLIASSKRLKAQAAYESHKMDEAFSLARSSVALFESIGDEDGVMRSRRMLGFLLHRVGRFGEAKQIQESGLERARALQSAEHEAYMLCGLGSTLRSLGELDKAERHLASALCYAEVLPDRFLSLSIHYHMANLWDDRSFTLRAVQRESGPAFREACAVFERCIEIARESGNGGMEFFSLIDYAVCLLGGHLTSEAQTMLDVAHPLLDSMPDNRLAEGWYALSHSEVLAAQEEWSGTIERAEWARSLFSHTHHSGMAQACRVLSVAYTGLGERDQAERLRRQALVAAASCGQRIERERTLAAFD